MKFVLFIVAAAFLVALGTPAKAQEPELVNEIVARVNNDIITRTDYFTAIEQFKEELKQQMKNKSDAEIAAEFEKLRPTILDLMIEDILLEQKAKELNIDVEAEINQQMLELMKQGNFKTLGELEQAMKGQGVDPDGFRASVRRRLQQQYVVQREVLAPIYNSLSEKDKRAAYDKYKEQYLTIPGDVTLSEIFLPLEGHTAAEVEQRARRLVTELRAGGNFADAVKANTPVTRASRSQDGKLGVFKAGELKEEIATAIKPLKAGDVTEPIRVQDAFQIIRVDAKTEAKVRPFEDKEVQDMIARVATMDRADEARKKYLKKLREEAFIDINKSYQTAQAQPAK
jgi:peptidyl-prolyl cis-trans isomerase SurA